MGTSQDGLHDMRENGVSRTFHNAYTVWADPRRQSSGGGENGDNFKHLPRQVQQYNIITGRRIVNFNFNVTFAKHFQQHYPKRPNMFKAPAHAHKTILDIYSIASLGLLEQNREDSVLMAVGTAEIDNYTGNTNSGNRKILGDIRRPRGIRALLRRHSSVKWEVVRLRARCETAQSNYR